MVAALVNSVTLSFKRALQETLRIAGLGQLAEDIRSGAGYTKSGTTF